MNIELEVPEVPIEKTIGQYKTKERFLEFVGVKGVVNFIDNEAFIEGKHLSGLDLDGVTFKLTICDEGVNFDEVDTNVTTPEQRGRLLEVINDKTLAQYNKRMVVRELPFKSVKKIKDQSIDLYLAVEYKTPISKLASLFDEEIVEVSDDQNSKLDALFSLFEEESVAEILFKSESDEELSRELEGESEVDTKTDTQKALEESFKKMKEEKVLELQKRINQQEDELKRFNYEKLQAESKIEGAEKEIGVLSTRLDSLKPSADANGYYFFVSERLNEKISLEDDVANLIREKVSKVKSINVEAFMKLFEAGEYDIKLGTKSSGILSEVTDYEGLSNDIKSSIKNIGASIIDKKLSYTGEMNWHEIVEKMIKAGFSQDSEFDKMSGSNSYFSMYGGEDSNESAEKQNEENIYKATSVEEFVEDIKSKIKTDNDNNK